MIKQHTSNSLNVVFFGFLFVSLIFVSCSIQLASEYFHIKKLIRIGNSGIVSNAVVTGKYINSNGKWFNYYMIVYTYITDDNIKRTSEDRIDKERYFKINNYSTIIITYNNYKESYIGDIRNISIESILLNNLFYYIILFVMFALSLISEAFMLIELSKEIRNKKTT